MVLDFSLAFEILKIFCNIFFFAMILIIYVDPCRYFVYNKHLLVDVMRDQYSNNTFVDLYSLFAYTNNNVM